MKVNVIILHTLLILTCYARNPFTFEQQQSQEQQAEKQQEQEQVANWHVEYTSTGTCIVRTAQGQFCEISLNE